jgi:hypothetical protein
MIISFNKQNYPLRMYTAEGFGEAEPPQDPFFLVVFAGKAGKYHQKKDDSWRAASPPNLPVCSDEQTVICIGWRHLL